MQTFPPLLNLNDSRGLDPTQEDVLLGGPVIRLGYPVNGVEETGKNEFISFYGEFSTNSYYCKFNMREIF
jgi:hypothetical protein